MNRIELRVAGLLALLLVLALGGAAWAAAPSLPSASVGAVTLSKANVCSADTSEIVSATVTGSYDSNSGPTTTINNSCTVCNAGNNRCGTGNASVNRVKTFQTQTVTVSNQTVTASATDSNANSTASQNGASPLAFSQTLTATGPDGKITVTVSATASEDVTTDTSTTVTFYSSTNCTTSTAIVSGPTTALTSPTVTNTSAVATNSAFYLLDLEAPTMRVASYSPNDLTITAGGSVGPNTRLKNGSAGTSYSFDLEAYNVDNNLGAQNFGAFSFGNSPDGIDSNENNNSRDLLYQTQCTTPPGIYFMKATANAVDLCGNSFPLNLNDPLFLQQDPAKTRKANTGELFGNNQSGTFEILSPVELSTTTHIIGPLPPNGEYSFEQCFTTKGNPRKIIVNPGSAHIAAVVNATVLGTCEVSTFPNPTVKLTLPTDFTFYLTGGSPAAHVFVGEAVGFDLHDPELNGFVEVTDAAIISGDLIQTITVDLSNVDVGFGPGQIPTSDTIYVRAHTRYTGSDATPHGQYRFLTEAGIGSVMTASDTEDLHANAPDCTPDGLLP